MGASDGRRVRRLSLSWYVMQMIREPKVGEWLRLTGVPRDADVIGADCDPRTGQCWLTLWSAEFSAVPDGYAIPQLDVSWEGIEFPPGTGSGKGIVRAVWDEHNKAIQGG